MTKERLQRRRRLIAGGLLLGVAGVAGIVGVPRVYCELALGFRALPLDDFANSHNVEDPAEQLVQPGELPEQYVTRILAAQGEHAVVVERRSGVRYVPRRDARYETSVITFHRDEGDSDFYPYAWRLTFWRVRGEWVLAMVESEQCPVMFSEKHV